MLPKCCIHLILAALPAAAQIALPPVLEPRGAQNDVTLMPAPGAVSPGGWLRLSGLNFTAASEWKAGATPLPTRVGEPALEVLIANRPAGLLEVGPTRILCQVPLETPQGVVPVLVRRGEQASRAARILVQRLAPAMRTANGSGYGPAKGAAAGSELSLRATGVGQSEPEVESGAAGPADPPAVPAEVVRLLVGGLQAEARVTLARDIPGEFEIRATAPQGAQAGDVLQLVAGGVAGALATYGSRPRAQLEFLPLPEGLSDPRGMVAADLRHAWTAVNAARGEDGCYATWLFDFGRKQVTSQEGCPAAVNRQAAAAWLAPLNTALLASWLGPLETEPANGISKRIRILNPAVAQALDVELPFAGQGMQAQADGGLLVLSPAGEAARIDPQTGEVSEAQPPPGAGGGGAAPGAGGNALNQAMQSREIDLGDGVKRRILSQPPRQATAAGVPLVVADDAEGKSRPQLVLVTQRLEVLGTRPFPEGWQPVVPPAQPVQVRPGQPAPPVQPTYVPLEMDPQTRTAYTLARRADDSRHGLALFALDDSPARALEFPEGWFAATCTSNIPLFNLELTRRVALFAARSAESAFRPLCSARGLIEATLGAQPSARVSELPGQGAVNVSAGINDVNDYLYGTDADPTLQGASGALYVFDSASEVAARLDAPAGVTAFVQARPLPELNAVVALGRATVAGDEGIVYFDLTASEARLLPAPDGFASVQIAALFPATRKLLARGIRTGATGVQYIVYDLATFDATVVPNPEGVASVGALPPAQGAAAGPQPAVLERISPKSGSVVALGYNRARQPVGVALLKLN